MWLIELLPLSISGFFINLAIITGLVLIIGGYFLNNITLITISNPIIKPITIAVGILLLVIGIYYLGAHNMEINKQIELAELNAKVRLAEVEASKNNEIVKIEYVTKVQTVYKTRDVIKEVIKNNTAIIDAECKVPPEAIAILNSAAKGK